ncbi:uncharacterized PE-PGRS family protein PE_PGRS54-like [Paramacrobiotus metropolitanus]|uniref:uncharacterized PE-PGRS family protein PE_PGRS54-like n=1 Tax=Paramacrobiotus metropolitanus TaxID=2943436 RepID=UPI00244618C9|nr:uncharacterized PE-PGRS family protein PE_PGRS54-like [Paramacrobiotus metropolitanus]
MRLYVGSLPNGYRLSELLQLFEQYGCVSRVTAIRDFAFLAMYDNEAAQAAVNALNSSSFMNQEIIVERARFPRGRFQNNRRYRAAGVQEGEGEDATSVQGQHYDGAYQQQTGRQYAPNGQAVYQQGTVVYSQDNAGYQGDAAANGANNNDWETSGQNYQMSSTATSSRGRRGRRGGRGGNQQYRNSADNQDYQAQVNYQNQSYSLNDTANQQYPANHQMQSNMNSYPTRGLRGGRRGRGRRGGGRGGMLRGSSSALQASELDTSATAAVNVAGGNGAAMEKVGVTSLDGGDRIKMSPGAVPPAGGQQFMRMQPAAVVGGAEAGKMGRGAGDM